MSTLRRLRSLPSHDLPGGISLKVAAGPRARLLGLMGLPAMARDHALLLPRCRSIHTFGMRFAIDLVWLDETGRVLRQDACVVPGRIRTCRHARAVVETSAGAGEQVAAALTAGSAESGLGLGLAGRSGAAR